MTSIPESPVTADHAQEGLSARKDVEALLACLPMSSDGTGHVVDCGYDDEGMTCGCYTLPERLGAALERILTSRTAALQAERDAAIDRLCNGLHKWREDAERLRVERDALRERVEALANEWWRFSCEAHPEPTWRAVCHDLRALLADPSEASTGD